MSGKPGRSGKNRKYPENSNGVKSNKLDNAYKGLETMQKRVEEGLVPAHNRLKALQEWHLDMLKDRYLFNWPYDKLAEKYDCSMSWAKVICKSDVGIKAAREIINTPDVELIRNQLKWLSGSGFTLCKRIIDGSTDEDGIELLDRGKFTLEVMKLAGIPAVKEHKFTFEHIAKQAGERIKDAGKTVEAQIVEAEIKKIALDSEND